MDRLELDLETDDLDRPLDLDDETLALDPRLDFTEDFDFEDPPLDFPDRFTDEEPDRLARLESFFPLPARAVSANGPKIRAASMRASRVRIMTWVLLSNLVGVEA